MTQYLPETKGGELSLQLSQRPYNVLYAVAYLGNITLHLQCYNLHSGLKMNWPTTSCVTQTWCFSSSSFTVALKSLKPFDTDEEDELVVSFALVSRTVEQKMFPCYSVKTSPLLCLLSVKPERSTRLLSSGRWSSSQTSGWKLVSQNTL